MANPITVFRKVNDQWVSWQYDSYNDYMAAEFATNVTVAFFKLIFLLISIPFILIYCIIHGIGYAIYWCLTVCFNSVIYFCEGSANLPRPIAFVFDVIGDIILSITCHFDDKKTRKYPIAYINGTVFENPHEEFYFMRPFKNTNNEEDRNVGHIQWSLGKTQNDLFNGTWGIKRTSDRVIIQQKDIGVVNPNAIKKAKNHNRLRIFMWFGTISLILCMIFVSCSWEVIALFVPMFMYSMAYFQPRMPVPEQICIEEIWQGIQEGRISL